MLGGTARVTTVGAAGGPSDDDRWCSVSEADAVVRPLPSDPAEQRVDLSVIVPVKDEVGSLPQLVDEVRAALDAAGDAAAPWELIVVDDGSTDGSWEAISALAEQEPRLLGLRLRRNLGKSFALAAGVEVSRGAVIATMDGDLQDDASEILGMIDRLTEPADLVAGYKAERRDPLSKRLPSKLYNAVTGLVTGLKLHDHNCGLKVGRREVFEDVPLYGEMHRYIAATAHATGYRIVEQPVHHRPRQHGRSKFGAERYVRGALDLLTVITLTRFGRRPLHLLGGFGLLTGAIGSTILLYLAGVWFLTDQAIGGRPLLLLGILLVILAVQLISVGLLAELVISREVSEDRPSRKVAERVGARATDPGA